MYPPPRGPDLTAEQVRELEDTFLCSDPWSHFRSAIAMLLQRHDLAETSAPKTDVSSDRPASAAFRQHLGRPVDPFADLDGRAARTQVVADAYALRHHVAECLIRLAAAVLDDRADEQRAGVWARLSDGLVQTKQVLERLQRPLTASDARSTFTSLVIPSDAHLDWCCDARLASAIDVFGGWLQHASDLLHGHELQLGAAHNKVKHGFAVRARDDLKVMFTTQGAAADGTVSLGALTGPDAVDVFDRPVLEILARAPKLQGHRQGLELTQLRVDASAVLAEAYMLAWTHGAMFHTAARAHFHGREALPDHLRAPNYPGLPVGGPHPNHIAKHALVGLRYPLTTPASGGPARPAGVAFRDTFQTFTFTGPAVRDVVVVDDPPRPDRHEI